MKKCLSLVLAVVLLLSLLPGTTVFAAKETFKPIEAVSINEVSSPAAGTEVQFSANCETTGAGIDTVQWFESTTQSGSGTEVSRGAKFKPGYYYTVTVQLKITHSAYYFKGNGKDVTATFNGKTATVTTLDTAQKIKVSYTFPMCLATVSKFEFTLAAPTAGKAPHYPLLTGTGYETNNRGNDGAGRQNGIWWRNETDGKTLFPDESPKFEAGKKYSANVTVATTTGYRLASSISVKVNGKAVTAERVDNQCFTFKVEFTVPKAHTHTESSWKTDADGHWKICTDTSCGAVTVSKEAHKDANNDGKCDVCAYSLPKTESSKPESSKPESSKPESSDPESSEPEGSLPEDADDDTSAPADVDGEDEDDNGNGINKGIIWIILGVVLALILGGVVVLAIVGLIILLTRKKKKANK